MSKLRALELAAGLFSGRADTQPSVIVEYATAFAAFLGEESQTIGGVAGKPRKPKPDAAPAAPISDPETPAAAAAANAATVTAAAPVQVATAPAAVAASPAAVAAPAASGVTQQDIKDAVGKLATNAAAGGGPKAREILQKYGATNISTLKPEHYTAAKKDIDAVLAAADIVG